MRKTNSLYSTSFLPLPRTNVVLMLFLDIITLGIYEPIWYIQRRHAINKLLGSSEKIGAEPVIILILTLFQFISGFFNRSSDVDPIGILVWIASWGISILMAFKVKKIIMAYLKSQSTESVHFSGFFTFLFRIFYLQYKINRLHKKIVS